MKKLLLIFLLWQVLIPAKAQKVALVLSGGGAKGLAHIGVLKYIEEHHIPVDYIVGTSMGAIVGGFYAAGYSPEEIETIVLSRDFQNWVKGITGEKYNTHYFSKTDDATMVSVSLGVDKSLNPRFSATFADDAVLNFILARDLSQASAVARGDFNNLFVPFRAMAAEIFTQSQVVLDSGELQEAVRASMAIPFVYRPVRSNDNKLLFDGGLYNNFPIDVALKIFNPDVIIGVNVANAIYEEYPYKKDEQLISSSLFVNLLNKSDPSQLRDKDIYIAPDLEGLSAADFSKARQYIDSGYIAAARKGNELSEKIEESVNEDALNQKREEFRAKEPPLVFNSIQFRGFNAKQMTFMKHVFKVHKRNTHSINEIQRNYYQLISSEFFKELYPRIRYFEQDSSFVFELENKYDKSLKFDLGGFLTSRNIGELYLGMRFNAFSNTLTENRLQFYTGRFYQSVRYTSRVNLVGSGFFFIEPEFVYNNWDYIQISDLLKAHEPENKFAKQNDITAGIKWGWPAGAKYKLSLKGYYVNNTDHYSNKNEISSTDILDKTIFEGFKGSVCISRNSLNRKEYADRGTSMKLSFNYYNGNEIYAPGTTSVFTNKENISRTWFNLKFEAEHYLKITNRLTGGWMAEGVYSNQPFFKNYTSTILVAPAFYPLNDSRMLVLDGFHAFNYGAGGLKAIYRIGDRFDVRAEGYVFKPVREIIQDDQQTPYLREFNKDVRLAGTLQGVYNSPVGPISLGLNYYSVPDMQLGVFFHIGYMIFNPRSME